MDRRTLLTSLLGGGGAVAALRPRDAATPLAPVAKESDRNWRDWVSFVFTDNSDRFQRMTDGELRAYMVERWDAVQKGVLADGRQV